MTMHERYNGRSQRVHEHLAKHPKGVTLRGLIVALEPGCKPNNMTGTLSTLEKQGKVVRVVREGVTHFRATATALVDGRVAANQVPGGKARRKRPSSGYADPVAVATHIKRDDSRKRRAVAAVLGDRTAAIKAAVGRHAEPQPRRTGLNSCYMRNEVEARRPMREALAADVAAFEAGGGVIERLAPGACSKPLMTVQDFNEASWRARQRRLSTQTDSTNDDIDDGDLADVA
ncbi:hypothetical protein [Lysobacter olei]